MKSDERIDEVKSQSAEEVPEKTDSDEQKEEKKPFWEMPDDSFLPF